ncbi:MAG: PfkB family carbohydrate kinase, partial [Nanoarchaeota archaeon]
MDIKKILDNFSKIKVAVIGDVMLDRYVIGPVHRLSPEAPVPLVKQEKDFFTLGGAANTAANIESLGGKVFLFGYVAEDAEAEALREELNAKRIQHKLFSCLDCTTLKTRIIGDKQQIVRIDREVEAKASSMLEERLLEEVFSINPDILVASDYGKGVLSTYLFSSLKERAKKRGIRIIVDPRPQNKDNYREVYLVTPNLKEAEDMTGLKEPEEIGRRLQKELGSNVLLTRGPEGMSLFEGDKIVNIPTFAIEVYDVTGAGDTVVAVSALSIASGVSLEEAAILANHAAGIVVSRIGTATV